MLCIYNLLILFAFRDDPRILLMESFCGFINLQLEQGGQQKNYVGLLKEGLIKTTCSV